MKYLTALTIGACLLFSSMPAMARYITSSSVLVPQHRGDVLTAAILSTADLDDLSNVDKPRASQRRSGLLGYGMGDSRNRR